MIFFVAGIAATIISIIIYFELTPPRTWQCPKCDLLEMKINFIKEEENEKMGMECPRCGYLDWEDL